RLADEGKLQRALVKRLPSYLEGWTDMGPSESADTTVYLHTAVWVDDDGIAHSNDDKLADSRWSNVLISQLEDAIVCCGDGAGKAAWHEVPGEHRNALRRVTDTQADTEPASVEQQPLLGHTAPSLYDMRNLFQGNGEEGRHLWAMVYLLHKYFGRDGRDEAEALLERRSGDQDHPRILAAFNEKTPDWLSFFMFTYLDRKSAV